ncbi:MAG: hypothetical protein NTU80_10985 [Verrucomicrobia bacterium]|nr:hypothetical protein [Verrucomicrobiota bacterium]
MNNEIFVTKNGFDSLSTVEIDNIVSLKDYVSVISKLLGRKDSDFQITPREEFYALQKVIRDAFERLGELDKAQKIDRFAFFNGVVYKGDGHDLIRVLQSITESFCGNSAQYPDSVSSVASVSYSWPILYESGANAMENIDGVIEKLKIASKTPLNLKQTRKGKKRGKCAKIETGTLGDLDFDQDGIGQECNAVIIKHHREITAFAQHDSAVPCSFQLAEYVQNSIRNQAIDEGCISYFRVYQPSVSFLIKGGKYPDWWIQWQSELKKIDWFNASLNEQFRIIWLKIMGEYLGTPEKHAPNESFREQYNLREIVKEEFAKREADRISKTSAERIANVNRIINEVDCGLHSNGTMQTLIKNRLKKAFKGLHRVI